MNRLMTCVLAVCFVWPPALLAQENLIVNGGFETRTPGLYTFYPGDDMHGWLIGDEPPRGSIIQSPHPSYAHTGEVLAIFSYEGGSISQVIDLSPGREYTLRFFAALGADFFRNPGRSILNVESHFPEGTFENNRELVTVVLRGGGRPDDTFRFRPDWLEYSVTFQALADRERLFFGSGRNLRSDIIFLDSISLVEIPVPEPSSLILVVLGAVGFICRRVGFRLTSSPQIVTHHLAFFKKHARR